MKERYIDYGKRLVQIIKDVEVRFYLVDEALFDQLPKMIGTQEDAEKVASLIHEKGVLQAVMRPDYILNLRH